MLPTVPTHNHSINQSLFTQYQPNFSNALLEKAIGWAVEQEDALYPYCETQLKPTIFVSLSE